MSKKKVFIVYKDEYVQEDFRAPGCYCPRGGGRDLHALSEAVHAW
jgi:hypothetical protein|tara:strand:- start:2775 stop:2909 length:135 start_codon:yes stop_codon:yes gene_type:complete